MFLTRFQFILQLDNYEIRKGKNLKCNISVANLRLFVGNIPKSKSKDEIVEEFSKITGNIPFLTDYVVVISWVICAVQIIWVEMLCLNNRNVWL